MVFPDFGNERIIAGSGRSNGYTKAYPYAMPVYAARLPNAVRPVAVKQKKSQRHELLVRRSSTPERKVINLVIQRPKTPPPIVTSKTVYDKAERPIINTKCIRVPPRGTNFNKAKTVL